MSEWEPIDDRYLVSKEGEVKNTNGKIIGQWKSDQGYMLVRLSSPRRVERVHRLVAAAFVQNPLGLDTVNHIDCDRSNNDASNLEWCTQAENLQHSENLGRMQRDYWVGKRSPNAALTDDQVRKIRSDYAAGGLSLNELSIRFGISKRTIGRIIHKETYQDVQ